jgi:flavin reductase (DIM6/NTAB) family NADH-FMN oxidoreductase RutF
MVAQQTLGAEHMKTFQKRGFPVDQTRRYLEPGPIVLVSSHWQGESNIMTMGWHMMLEYDQIGCYIWDENHSFDLIRKSKQCVINLPTIDLIDTIVGIGNSSGAEIDKFVTFGLTQTASDKVSVPMIKECYANFECRLEDGSMIARRGLFIWRVVKAHVARTPQYPTTVHYRGHGIFMVSGRHINLRRKFKPQNL